MRGAAQPTGRVTHSLAKDVSHVGIVCVMVARGRHFAVIGVTYLGFLPAQSAVVAVCNLDDRMTVPPE